MFRWFSNKSKPLKDMSLNEVTEHLYDTYPSMQTLGEYVHPQFRCSHWLLFSLVLYEPLL